MRPPTDRDLRKAARELKAHYARIDRRMEHARGDNTDPSPYRNWYTNDVQWLLDQIMGLLNEWERRGKQK